MLVLGLLLILLAAGLTIGAAYDGSESATVELLGYSFDTTVAGVFFTGAGTMLLLLLGVWLLTASMGRARRRRAERKQLKARHRDSVTQLEQERNELRAENERLAQERAVEPVPAESTAVDAAPEDTVLANRTHQPVPAESAPAEPLTSRGASGAELESPLSTGGHAAPRERTSTTDPADEPGTRI
ncbi:MAG: hypothetical protein QOJ90_2682 [Actinomycetota bacterium]|jgi:cytoskeletal protein RodZ|nr:hypothetical protein [Actinomycetota bacterium]